MDCHYRWFHFECVGLKKEPKGDWTCFLCTEFGKKSKMSELETENEKKDSESISMDISQKSILYSSIICFCNELEDENRYLLFKYFFN